MRKKYLIVLESNSIDLIDQKVNRPCSRSDIIDAAIKYLLQSPYVFDAFVKDINQAYKLNAMRDIQS